MWLILRKKNENDNPKDIDYLRERKRTPKLNKKSFNLNNSKNNKCRFKKDNKSYCYICDMNGYFSKECRDILISKIEKIILKNKNNSNKGRQKQQQLKKPIGLFRKFRKL